MQSRNDSILTPPPISSSQQTLSIQEKQKMQQDAMNRIYTNQQANIAMNPHMLITPRKHVLNTLINPTIVNASNNLNISSHRTMDPNISSHTSPDRRKATSIEVIDSVVMIDAFKSVKRLFRYCIIVFIILCSL